MVKRVSPAWSGLRLALLILGALAAGGLVSALDWESPRLPPLARMSALGGLHAALTDDVYTIFANPAGLRSAERGLQVSELTTALAGPIFDIAGVILRGVAGESVTDMLLDPDVQDLFRGTHAGLAVAGPLSFVYAGGGIGFTLCNWADVAFDSASSTSIRTIAGENLLVAGGYALEIPVPAAWGGKLDVGGMLKTTIRAQAATTKSLLELVDLFSDPASLLTSEPFLLSLGVGLDLGVLYRQDNWLAVGVVVRDAFTPTRRTEYASFSDFADSADPADVSAGRVKPDLSVGVRYSPRIVAVERYVDRFQFLLDYNDILDFLIDPASARNPILHVSIGAEAVLLHILSLRVGIGQGLLAAGLELDLAFVDLSLSMFGTELGLEPGLRPTYNLILGLRFEL